MNRAEKTQEIADIKASLADSELVIVTHYTGLNAQAVTALRSACRKEEVTFRVAKNTLVKRALADTKFAGIADLFTGPTAIASSKDPMAAARAAYMFSKTNDKLVILGGASSAEVLSVETIKFLATLPSLDALRGKIIGILQAPGAQLARLANAYATKDGAAAAE